MTSQYRYSQNSFKRSVITALGLTLIVSFLVWLFSRLFGLRHADLITLVSGAMFFSFCSAAMIWRYVRREIVVAVRPDGLFDARHSREAVPWDDIKDVRLGRAENDFELGIYLWPDRAAPGGGPAFTVDLSPLDAPVETVLQALSTYKQITMEQT